MNTATLNTSTLGSNPSPSVSSALGELVAAAHHLVLALWASVVHHPKAALKALSAMEEANELRSMADGELRRDPRFAQELYGAADRHERASGVQ